MSKQFHSINRLMARNHATVAPSHRRSQTVTDKETGQIGFRVIDDPMMPTEPRDFYDFAEMRQSVANFEADRDTTIAQYGPTGFARSAFYRDLPDWLMNFRSTAAIRRVLSNRGITLTFEQYITDLESGERLFSNGKQRNLTDIRPILDEMLRRSKEGATVDPDQLEGLRRNSTGFLAGFFQMLLAALSKMKNAIVPKQKKNEKDPSLYRLGRRP